MIGPDILAAVIPVLEQLDRQGVPHHVCGSVASSILGVARSTLDVDLVADLREEHVPVFCAALEVAFYVDLGAVLDAVRRRTSFNLIHLATVLKVDIFCLKDRPFDRAAFSRARYEKLEGVAGLPDLSISSPEDTVLHKLEWFRSGGGVADRQWSDAIGVLKVQAGGLDLDYMRHWAQELSVGDLLEKALAESGL